MKIKFYSPTIKRKEMDAVLTAMVEGKIGPGEHTKFLLQAVREKIHFDHCLALRSPVLALNLALKSLGLEKNQGVVISALSPLYYKKVIEDLGLIPIYCDVLPSTVSLTSETVEKALSNISKDLKPGCIILHHVLGYLSDGEGLKDLGLPIIEDWSQSYGSASTEIPVESSGLFTMIGLEERDMFTSGGGALLYSMGNNVIEQNLPPEYGLPDMNAALALVQFKEFSKNISKRREIAHLYTQSALRTRHKMFVFQGEYNNYSFPLILEKGLKDVKTYARKKDIALESAFENTLIGCGVIAPEICPIAYSLSLRTVIFPLYPRLGMTDAGKVAKLIQTLP